MLGSYLGIVSDSSDCSRRRRRTSPPSSEIMNVSSDAPSKVLSYPGLVIMQQQKRIAIEISTPAAEAALNLFDAFILDAAAISRYRYRVCRLHDDVHCHYCRTYTATCHLPLATGHWQKSTLSR